MAYEQTVHARFGQSELKARFRHFRDMLDQRAARQAAYRRTVDELHALSDRDLADLGFHRSEIPHIAREAVETA